MIAAIRALFRPPEWEPYFIGPADPPAFINGEFVRGQVQRRIVKGKTEYRIEPEDEWLARQF